MTAFEQITEGTAKILVAKEKKISKDLPVFYNPDMKLNRDIAILLLNAIDKKNLKIADILVGTGVRSIRFVKELKKDKIEEILINDADKNSFNIIKKNLKLNKIKSKIKVFNREANKLLVESEGFDYIDIDPFGSPNPFLDISIKKLRNNSILAVTATDTAALCGTSPKACLRKYWAVPLHDEQMKETGARILARKVQLVGSQYDKALIPIFCHATQHYIRIYFNCKTRKTDVDNLLKQHKFFENNNGPIWTGQLWDALLVSKMLKNCKNNKELFALLKIISKECNFSFVGFYDIYDICSKLKVNLPKREELLSKIKQEGYFASETHFSYRGVKSDISADELKKLLQ